MHTRYYECILGFTVHSYLVYESYPNIAAIYYAQLQVMSVEPKRRLLFSALPVSNSSSNQLSVEILTYVPEDGDNRCI